MLIIEPERIFVEKKLHLNFFYNSLLLLLKLRVVFAPPIMYVTTRGRSGFSLPETP